MIKIVLIGFAGCGKSTVGKLLADKLGYAFVDTDSEIEKNCQLTIPQIFENYGEQHFRQLESQLLTTLVEQENTVVSCGGGSVLAETFDAFAKNSVVVWLTASAQTVLSRFGSTPRPLFDKLSVQQLEEFIAHRSKLYKRYSAVELATDDKTPQRVAEEIYAKVN